jgi:hypothetical protein
VSSDLDHRITHQLDEIDARLAALLSSRGELGSGDSRRLLLALDRRLAAMAAALDDEAS